MASDSVSIETPVNQRLEVIRDRIRENKDVEDTLPGISDLLELLDRYLDSDSKEWPDHIDFLRGVLKVYREYQDDQAYQDYVQDKLTIDERDRLERFVDGKPAADAGSGFVIPHSIGVRDEIAKFHGVKKATISAAKAKYLIRTSFENAEAEYEINGEVAPQHGFRAFVHKLASFLWGHSHKDEVKIWGNVEFTNWGQTVNFTPKYTLWPRTVKAVVNIVKFAAKENLSVRCAGYRHSWSPIFGHKGQILISTIDPDTASKLPNTASLPFHESEPTELESIDIVNNSKLKAAPSKTLVRVGTAVTNERLRRWCVKHNKVTIPLNVIMVEITLGGSNAPICHGAGLRHKTLSDLVRAIEYVDCHGHVQTVTDPQQLRAASGCFGLMGIVTHITIEFDPMTYAQLQPKKLDVAIAIPPPDGYEDKIPAALRVARTPEQRQEDIAAFEKACTSDYYCEWFWFPYSDQAWVNTWNNTTDETDVVDFPSDVSIFVQWAGTVMFNIAQYSKVLDTIGKLIHIDFVGTTIISRAAMWMLGDKALKTYLPDALHFQRAIQNVRVRDLEVEMPVPNKHAGSPDTAAQPDWTYARRAWWDAIILAYAHARDQPQRMPLEMRIMGDSDVVLAPQRGNKLGTCSIEVLTLEREKDKWPAYSQEVLDVWMSYRDGAGAPLRTRPHWAKEWRNLTVDGEKWETRLRKDYKEEIVEFRETLAAIGKDHGWSLDEIRTRFSNELFDDFIFAS